VRRGIAVPLLFVWLVVLWIALWGEWSWANLLGGIGIALAVMSTAAIRAADLQPRHIRPLWAIWYATFVLWSLVVSNVRLARDVLSVRPRTHTGIIAVGMRCDSDMIVNLVANSITLTPGTITVDVRRRPDHAASGDDSTDGVMLYVHAIYAADVEQVRGDVLRLEELALRAFGSIEEYEAVRRQLHQRSPT
jgi:multicomponent Na+:H+ antiporter subunit E